MAAVMVVVVAPSGDQAAGVGQAGEQVFLFWRHSSLKRVDALHEAVLHRLPRGDVVPFEAALGRSPRTGLQKFVPNISLSVETSNIDSASNFFSFAFSSASAFSRFAFKPSMPPYFEHHLLNVASLTPCLRHSSAALRPHWRSFSSVFDNVFFAESRSLHCPLPLSRNRLGQSGDTTGKQVSRFDLCRLFAILCPPFLKNDVEQNQTGHSRHRVHR